MPYLSSDLVSEIRSEIRKTFPKFKISVTREHHSTVRVVIKSGPIPMTTHPAGYEHVNNYYIKDHYADTPEVCKVLTRINDIVSKSKCIEHVCSDYGSIPNYYVSINIGKWDSPYIVSN